MAITCNTGTALAEGVRDRIRSNGNKSECYAGHIGTPAAVEEIREAVLRDFGQVDILVNNAGITRDKSFKKMTPELWDEVINVNLTGVFHMTRQFIEPMAERGWGRVINISSVIGHIGNFGQANYAATKAGLFGFTRSLAREYARKGVTVNAVAPGFIRTEMVEKMKAEGKGAAALEAVVALTPVGRLGETEDVAAGVLFLASPATSFITGTVLDINGGYSM